jgi:uncharacterized protein
VKLVVLADTHIVPGRRRRLPDAVYAALDTADAVLHAGDIVTADLVHELGGFAPVHAVLGNNDDGDLAGMLPETLELDFDGVRIGMIHDSGASTGRPGRMRRRFPDCDVVVYGHSHIPFCGEGDAGQLLFNPGSPTDKRRQPFATYGILEVEDGRVDRAEIIPLDRPAG